MIYPDLCESILKPECCRCRNREFPETPPFYTHQDVELPEIKMEVTYFVLCRDRCPCCRKMNKGLIPQGYRTGYEPGLSATITHMAGGQGDSRVLILEFCSSVSTFPSVWARSQRSSTGCRQPQNLTTRGSAKLPVRGRQFDMGSAMWFHFFGQPPFMKTSRGGIRYGS
jgi:hypothetical protein